MCRRDLGAARTDKYRNGGEQPDFSRDRYRYRHTKNDDLAEQRRSKLTDAREDLEPPQARTQRHVKTQRYGDYPHRNGARIAATFGTQRRRTEMPEHEHIVQDHVTD